MNDEAEREDGAEPLSIPPDAERMSVDIPRLCRYAAQGVAVAVIVTAGVLLLTVDHDTLHRVRSFPWPVLVLLALLIALSWLVNGVRTWLLARAAGHALRPLQALLISMSMEFGIAASPGGVAGLAVKLTLLKRAGIPVPAGASMIAAHAMNDTLIFAALTPLALYFLVADPEWRKVTQGLRAAPGSAWVLPCIAAVAVALLVLARRPLLRGMARAGRSGAARRGVRFRLWEMANGLASGLRRSARSVRVMLRRRRGYLAADGLLSAAQMSCRYGVLPIVLLAFGPRLNPLPLFVLQGLLFSLSLILVVPGGGGGVELLASVVLPAMLPRSLAGVALLLWRFFTYHLYLLGGGAVFVWTVHRLDRLFPRGSPPAPRTESGSASRGIPGPSAPPPEASMTREVSPGECGTTWAGSR